MMCQGLMSVEVTVSTEVRLNNDQPHQQQGRGANLLHYI